ncbi:MAG: class I SAM-dependent methyltransferase [Myxococcota bacterium]|nr:class I SAM-dependent methyltransferase [Myxococcota bacterium]
MNAKTREQLIAINRRFYSEVAGDFDATRNDAWPGWARAIAHAEPLPGQPLHVLDVGCGNGRLVDMLSESRGEVFEYLGVDFSQALLERARSRCAARTQIRFETCDVLAPGDDLPRREPGFDLVALFGVLHHVPSAELRRALFERLLERLRPGGVLAVTAWQFGDRERFRARRVPVETFNAGASEPIDPAQLDSGDHLLRFAGAKALRYCNHCSEAELHGLFADLPLRWLDRYTADGKTADLNAYAVVQRAV